MSGSNIVQILRKQDRLDVLVSTSGHPLAFDIAEGAPTPQPALGSGLWAACAARVPPHN